jgi:hypothetical protein
MWDTTPIVSLFAGMTRLESYPTQKNSQPLRVVKLRRGASHHLGIFGGRPFANTPFIQYSQNLHCSFT